MSVNDIVGLAITGDSEQSSVRLPQLDEDLPRTNYIDDLSNVFMDHCDRFRFKRRSGCARI